MTVAIDGIVKIAEFGARPHQPVCVIPGELFALHLPTKKRSHSPYFLPTASSFSSTRSPLNTSATGTSMSLTRLLSLTNVLCRSLTSFSFFPSSSSALANYDESAFSGSTFLGSFRASYLPSSHPRLCSHSLPRQRRGGPCKYLQVPSPLPIQLFARCPPPLQVPRHRSRLIRVSLLHPRLVRRCPAYLYRPVHQGQIAPHSRSPDLSSTPGRTTKLGSLLLSRNDSHGLNPWLQVGFPFTFLRCIILKCSLGHLQLNLLSRRLQHRPSPHAHLESSSLQGFSNVESYHQWEATYTFNAKNSGTCTSYYAAYSHSLNIQMKRLHLPVCRQH